MLKLRFDWYINQRQRYTAARGFLFPFANEAKKLSHGVQSAASIINLHGSLDRLFSSTSVKLDRILYTGFSPLLHTVRATALRDLKWILYIVRHQYSEFCNTH